MSNINKVLIWLLTFILNIFFLGEINYWNGLQGIESVLLYVLLGIMAAVILGLSEVCILVQIYYRVKLRSYKYYVLDRNIWFQVIILLFYYFSSIFFSYEPLELELNSYLVMLPIALSSFMIKASKVVWIGKRDRLFLNERGELFKIDAIREEDTKIKFICFDQKQGEYIESIRKSSRTMNIQ